LKKIKKEITNTIQKTRQNTKMETFPLAEKMMAIVNGVDAEKYQIELFEKIQSCIETHMLNKIHDSILDASYDNNVFCKFGLAIPKTGKYKERIFRVFVQVLREMLEQKGYKTNGYCCPNDTGPNLYGFMIRWDNKDPSIRNGEERRAKILTLFTFNVTEELLIIAKSAKFSVKNNKKEKSSL
jgi:hypothetical protein